MGHLKAPRQDRLIVQPKLVVGRADDHAEREADQLADRVLAGVGVHGGVQRQTSSSADPLGGLAVDADIEARINRQRGGGSALDRTTRSSLEPAFGHDFSGVRVHTGGEADALNRSLQAKAFTTGSDVFFSAGAYAPGSPAGSRLLAHELSHVVQQGGGVQREAVQRAFDPKHPNTASITAAKELGGGSANKGVFMLTGQGGAKIVAKFINEDPRRAQMADIGIELSGLAASGAQPYGPELVNELADVLAALAAKLRRTTPTDPNAVALDAAATRARTQANGVVLMKPMGGEDLGTILIGNSTGAQDRRTSPVDKRREEAESDIRKAQASGVDPVALLANPRFHRNLGKLYAADGLLGSADRLAHDLKGKYATFNVTNFRVLADGTIETIDSDIVSMGYEFFTTKVEDKSSANWTKFLLEGFNSGDLTDMKMPGNNTQDLIKMFDVNCRQDIFRTVTDETKSLANNLDWSNFQLDFATFDASFMAGIVDALTGMLTGIDGLVAKARSVGGDDRGGGYVDADALAVKAEYLKHVLPELAAGGVIADQTKQDARRRAEQLAEKLAADMIKARELAAFDAALLPVPVRPHELGTAEKFGRTLGRGVRSIGGASEKSQKSKAAKQLRKGADTMGHDQTEKAFKDVKGMGGGSHRQQHAEFDLGLQHAILSMHRRANEFGNLDMQLMALETAISDPAAVRKQLAPYAKLASSGTYEKTVGNFKAVAKGYRDQLNRKGDKPADITKAEKELEDREGEFEAAIDWIERKLKV